MVTLTLHTSSADCYSNDGGGGFFSTLTYISMGNNSANNFLCTAWLPFVVNLSKNQVITSATLKIVAYANYSNYVYVRMGCEAADNPAAPTTRADLEGRIFTTHYNDYSLVYSYVAGTEYTYDVTTAVQEILNRAGWVPSNALAVIIKDNGSNADNSKGFASVEHTTYTEAILEIVYTPANIGNPVAVTPYMMF